MMLYVLYVCYAVGSVTPIILSLFHPLLIVLAVLLTVILVMLTHKYLHVEFEYSFVGGELTVSKIYGKKKRKQLITHSLRDALLIAPATEEHLEHVDGKLISALSTPDAEDALLLWLDVSKAERVVLLIESDERTIALCRRAAPAACSRELRSNI